MSTFEVLIEKSDSDFPYEWTLYEGGRCLAHSYAFTVWTARWAARRRARKILRRRVHPGPTFPIRETFEVN